MPFQHSDPVANREITSQEVFAADKALTQAAQAVVFYLPGDPSGSFGVGGEMAFASLANRPMAMMIRQGTTLSPSEQGFVDVEVIEMKRGPVIVFDSESETAALASLAQFLKSLG